jgi:hypothetical protein
MRRRWQRHVQSFRQSLSWLRISQETFRGVDCGAINAREPQARALVVGGGLAQSCRPWIRVCNDRVGGSVYSNLISSSILENAESRIRSRGFPILGREFFSTLVEVEHKSDENDRDESRGLRRENEQAEIVSRFEMHTYFLQLIRFLRFKVKSPHMIAVDVNPVG